MLSAHGHSKNTEHPPEAQVEIVYASARSQKVVYIAFEPAMRVIDAIHQSGLLAEFPEINTAQNAVGIFGRKVPLDTLLNAGDRVEIYRPLECSPQDARRRRAAKGGC